jgi:hypothetical protein
MIRVLRHDLDQREPVTKKSGAATTGNSSSSSLCDTILRTRNQQQSKVLQQEFAISEENGYEPSQTQESTHSYRTLFPRNMVNAHKLPLPKIMGRDSNATAATIEETKPKQNIFSKLLHRQPRVSKKSRYLFPADVASKEIIDEILQDKGIVSLEIEDVIADQNCRSLASNLSVVFCLGDREWQSVTFLDSIAPEEFITWRGHKHAVMTTLAKLEDNPLAEAQVHFQVNIEFPPGTSIKVFMDTLRNVNQHNLVQSVAFYGALYNVQKNTIIGHLQENVDSEGSLMNTIRLEVVCGLVESSTRFELVEMCLQKSRDMVAKATNTTESLGKKGQVMTDGSSSRKSTTSRTETETEPDSPTAEAIQNHQRRVRHGNRRSGVAATTRRSRVMAPAEATTVEAERKPRRAARSPRRNAVLPSPISVAEVYGSKDNKDKELSEMLDASLPSLLNMPEDAATDEEDELDKMHLSSSEFSTSECSDISSSRRRSDRSETTTDHRRRARASRRAPREPRESRTAKPTTANRRARSRSGTRLMSRRPS